MKLLTNDLANVRIFNDNSIHNASIDTSLNFVRLSDDGQTAFFRLDQHNARGEDWIFEAIDRRSPEDINDAKQMVQIGSRIHDIYIPDLNVDKERKEISFNGSKCSLSSLPSVIRLISSMSSGFVGLSYSTSMLVNWILNLTITRL